MELGDLRRELRERLEGLGRTLGRREQAHREGLEQARRCCEELREAVAYALEGFHKEAAQAGAPHLQITLGPLRSDDKHLRSVQFDLRRGRSAMIVTAKSRGEVTLVGPFHAGKTEGPCATFPFEARDELYGALVTVVERFLEEAATP